MDLNYKVTNLFPSSIHRLGIDNFDDYKDQLIKETYQERDKDPIGRRVSNRGGWQSSLTNIRNCKSETLNDIIVSSVSKLPILKGVAAAVSGWKNINGPGDFNVIHSHPKSHLSGVLWIKTPKNCGNIVFESPEIFNRYQELDSYSDESRLNSNNYMTYYFTPKEGNILIFSSDLRHEVKENKSNEDIISYSFNITLINEE